jgi:PAS domain S-box-containing protein
MEDEYKPKDEFRHLRNLAEKSIKRGETEEEVVADLSQKEIRRLLHELQVHQIELEMQNEELRRAQIELEESRDRYVDLYDFAPVGYVTLDKKGFIVEANLTAARLLGKDRKSLIKQPLSRFIPADEQARYYLYRRQVLATAAAHSLETPLLGKDGTTFYALLKGVAVFDDKGALICTREIISDITERKLTELALRKSEARLGGVLEAAPIGIGLISNGRMQWTNDSLSKMIGYSDEELKGKNPRVLYKSGADFDRVARGAGSSTVCDEGVYSVESRFRRKDGSAIEVLVSSCPVEEGNPAGEEIFTVQEITALKTAEVQIRASLKEKAVLLREIHHRTKNNLQVITSLLRLQAAYAKDKVDSDIFKESEARIRSMALVHEKLCQSEDMGRLDIRDYISGLTDVLVGSYVGVGSNVKLKKEIENMSFGIDTAFPLGFILTELVSNSVKHAFPGSKTKGEIAVSLRSVGNGEYELSVADNGVGLPDHVDVGRPQSIGFDLVDSFVSQLNGRLEIERDRGTAFRIRFSEAGRKKRR